MRTNNRKRNRYHTRKEKNNLHKSIVQVKFLDRNLSLTYYNDQFDLKCGDLVYVDGKLENHIGYVTDVNYNFKIKISDYKRVIEKVDTSVHGYFYMAGSHFVTFNNKALPKNKVIRWFKAPCDEDEVFVNGNDDTSFSLDHLNEMKVSRDVAKRGEDYYIGCKVKYICVDGTKGYAIVEGSRPYEVEFIYMNGQISHLTCSCYCSYNCKHEVATMLQLQETLEIINKNYKNLYERNNYFAAICKSTLINFAIDKKEKGSIML